MDGSADTFMLSQEPSLLMFQHKLVFGKILLRLWFFRVVRLQNGMIEIGGRDTNNQRTTPKPAMMMPVCGDRI